jgi:hypothetical protein
LKDGQIAPQSGRLQCVIIYETVGYPQQQFGLSANLVENSADWWSNHLACLSSHQSPPLIATDTPNQFLEDTSQMNEKESPGHPDDLLIRALYSKQQFERTAIETQTPWRLEFGSAPMRSATKDDNLRAGEWKLKGDMRATYLRLLFFESTG